MSCEVLVGLSSNFQSASVSGDIPSNRHILKTFSAFAFITPRSKIERTVV
nr:MAG TPA: hypothetical protein [Bacteriophage sp.]